jgi:iron(III) transport system substrate-binding protein
VLENNLVVMKAVNDGEVDAGIIYHYYWYRDQKEAGENSDSSRLHFFGDQDPGAFLSVSGAGVLAASDKQEDAQAFVEFLVGEEGQQAIADSYALEYPLNPAVTLDPPVKPFDELEPPEIDVATLNSEVVVQMMQDVGLL